MPQFRFSQSADRDMENIQKWTVQQFGEKMWLRYKELLTRSFLDLIADPRRRGTELLSGLGNNTFLYHIRHSRNRIKRGIKKPRHFLLYRRTSDETLEIIRVLHDSMDLLLHFPFDDQSEIWEEDE